MCNIGAIGLGIQGVGMVKDIATSMAEDRQYNDYQKYKNQAAWEDYIRGSRTLNNAYSQEQLSNAIQKQQAYLQSMQQKASAQAHGTSLGVTGNSIDNLYRGYDRIAAYNNYLSQRDLQMKGLEYNDRLINSLQYSTLNSLNENRYNYHVQNKTFQTGMNIMPNFMSTVKQYYGNSKNNKIIE